MTIDGACYCSCYGTKYKHVHVPVTGEFFVRNGKVLEVMESDGIDNGGDDQCDAWTVYTVREDDDE